jgi:hypothetical protein
MLVSDGNAHLAFSLSSNAISAIGMCTKGLRGDCYYISHFIINLYIPLKDMILDDVVKSDE